MQVNSTQSRDYFLIHTKYLDIDSAKLFRNSKANPINEVSLLEAIEYEKNEFLVFRTNGKVQPGIYIMSMGNY